MPASRALVTGASGFVGRHLITRLTGAGVCVRAAVRRPDAVVPTGVERVVSGNVDGDTDWSAALAGVECVFHLAARVHQMRDRSRGPLVEYRRVNRDGTERLARAAAAAKVRRLVFLSSVKVLGETRPRRYSEADVPSPADAYGVSKWEAEQALAAVARETGLEVVVLRAPLVYGPGVGANFLRLMRAVHRGMPLPLGAIDNERSLVYVANLADALVATATNAKAKDRTYLVSDGEDLSTPELIRRLAAGMGRRPRLLAVPAGVLRAGARALGRSAVADRLVGSLTVDSRAIREELGWVPPVPIDVGLTDTVRWFLTTERATRA